MVNYMKDVAKLLGIELGEKFYLEGQKSEYRITENGVETFYDDDEGWLTSAEISLDFLLTGRYIIVKKWKPRKNEEYYFPRPDTKALWHYDAWDENETDYHRLSHGLVFRTPREATEAAKKMLRVL